MSPFIGPIACRYFINVLRRSQKDGALTVSDQVFAWLTKHASDLGLEKQIPRRPRRAKDGQGYILGAGFLDLIKQISRRKPRVDAVNGSTFERQLAWITEIFRLDEMDQFVLGTVALFAGGGILTGLMLAIDDNSFHFGHDEVSYRQLVKAAPLGERGLRRRLMPRGPMLMLGLIEDRGSGDFAVSSLLRSVLENSETTGGDLVEELLPPAPSSDVSLEDFSFMKEDRDFARKLIAEGVRAGKASANLMFYGAPGTGKTALAISLASDLGLRPVLVGETSDQGGEPTRSERVSAFALLRTVAERKGGILLIVDEAEDLFLGVDDLFHSERSGSKAYMNRLLSENSVPTIFITNHPRAFGPASLRRMHYAIQFREPPAKIRGKILKKIFERRGVPFDDQTVSGLAADIRATTGIYDSAAQVTALFQGSEDTFRKAATSIMTVMGDVPVGKVKGQPFSIDLLKANIDLDDLTDRVVSSNCLDIALLASGPPGTGKSAYVRHLAERLGMETIERTASDILGKYVGESEKAVARAFQEARERRAFLIFDEVDSLIRSRESATRSWEVTQVNEMLSQMEAHPLPFACTTNAPDALDPAAARRFAFKLDFEVMDAVRIARAFRHFFGMEAPAKALSLVGLTPGDFMVVLRKMRFMGKAGPDQIAAWLAEESLAKPAARRRPIGYLAA